MTLLNKDKVLNGVGKAVDVANDTADKVTSYAKEKELDKKAEAAFNKVEGYIKDTKIEQKAEAAVSKTEQFIKDNEIDKKAANVARSVGCGIKRAGEAIEKTFTK